MIFPRSICHRQRAGDERVTVVENGVDQPGGARLLGGKAAAGIGQFAHQAGRDQIGQALQRADIGGHADIDFLDAKEGVGGAQANVASRNQIDPATDARALDRGDHRDPAAVDHRETFLHVENGPAQALAATPHVATIIRQGLEHAKIEPGGEMAAHGRNHHGARLGAFVDLVEGGHHVAPEGKSHCIQRLGADKAQMRDMVLHREVQGLVWHGELRSFGQRAFLTLFGVDWNSSRPRNDALTRAVHDRGHR